MSQPPRYWQITCTDKYLNQIIQFSLHEQNNIEVALIELSHQKEPMDYGSTDKCPVDGFVLAIFSGLPFEFIYQVDVPNQKLKFVSCEKITITHSFSTD